MESTFVVLFSRGPAWRAGAPLSAQPLGPHLEYMLGLHREGKMLMGGPFDDESGGLALLSVADLAEAKRLIEDDPAVVDGVLQAKVHAWNRVA